MALKFTFKIKPYDLLCQNEVIYHFPRKVNVTIDYEDKKCNLSMVDIGSAIMQVEEIEAFILKNRNTDQIPLEVSRTIEFGRYVEFRDPYIEKNMEKAKKQIQKIFQYMFELYDKNWEIIKENFI